MKKSLLALAVLSSFAGVASAQTSIVLYGVLDGSVRREVFNDGPSRIIMRNGSNYTSNRLGFRGTEDLGGGANAHFVLESGFFSGTGQSAIGGLAFDRLALVGVTTQYGTIDLGRLYGPQFYSAISSDPFETHYTAVDPITRNSISASQTSDNTTTSNTRTDNAIQYTNKFGDLTVRAMYAFGEFAGNNNAGSTKALGAVYQTSNFSLDAAVTKKKIRADNSNPAYGNDPAATADFRDALYYTVGGSYTIGELRATLGYAKERRETSGADHTERNLWTGLRYNFTPVFGLTGGYFKTNLSSSRGSSSKDLFMIGATYSLSKRTTLFAEIDHANFSGPEVPNVPIGQFLPSTLPGVAVRNGTMVGVSHAF